MYNFAETMSISSTCSSSSVALILHCKTGTSQWKVLSSGKYCSLCSSLSPHLLPQSCKLVWNIILSCLEVRRNISTSLALLGSALDWFLQISTWNHTRPTKVSNPGQRRRVVHFSGCGGRIASTQYIAVILTSWVAWG